MPAKARYCRAAAPQWSIGSSGIGLQAGQRSTSRTDPLVRDVELAAIRYMSLTAI
jgi:hypothetical protein